MRVAVTGASGYLARLLLPKLQAHAGVEAVLALDVRPLRPELRALGKVRFEAADVRAADFARLFSAAGPIGQVDAVVHLAFIVAPVADPALVYDVSVAGSERVFSGAAAAGVKHIVHASSVAAYGCVRGHELPLRESSPRRDQRDFYYAHTKWIVEEALDRFECAHPEIAVARMRPGIFLGSAADSDAGRVLAGPVLFGVSGHAPAQFACDEDVAQAFVLALEKRAKGAYLVTTEDAVPLEEVGAILGRPVVRIPGWLLEPLLRAVEGLGLPPTLLHRGWIEAARAPMHATSAKLREELGWRPGAPTSREALRRFAEVAGARRPNPGVWLFFTGLGGLTRATGGRIQLGDQQKNLRGLDITLNLELTGAGGSRWHVRFRDERAFFGAGLAPDATATATLSSASFVRMLAGDLAPTTATLTGAVRYRGEGHAQFVLGGLATLFRRLGDAGFAGRALRSLILKLAGAPARKPQAVTA